MDFYFHIGERALSTALLIAGPLLVTALLVGIGMGLFQAVTQIQEQTLAFIPKVLVVAAVLFLAGPWMVDQLVQLVQLVASSIAEGPRP